MGAVRGSETKPQRMLTTLSMVPNHIPIIAHDGMAGFRGCALSIVLKHRAVNEELAHLPSALSAVLTHGARNCPYPQLHVLTLVLILYSITERLNLPFRNLK